MINEIVVDLDEAAQTLQMIIHWHGGCHTALTMPKPQSGAVVHKTALEDLELIIQMARRYGDDEIARVLSKLGRRAGKGTRWSQARVALCVGGSRTGNARDRFKDQGPFQDLRAVFSLYLEPLTIVARDDAGIRHFDDLKGKRVNSGDPASGQHATLAVLMKAWGWTENDLGAVYELPSAEQKKPLCAGELDAVSFMLGHPSGSIRETTNACKSVLVEVSGPVIDKLVEEKVFYEHVSIPGGRYQGNPEDIRTFGVLATLVTSSKQPTETVYQLVKAVFENFDDFKKAHPALANLDKERMVKDGLSAPLHPGAVKYYKEAGLM